MIFVFLCLTSLSMTVSRSIQSSCKWHHFILFYGWVMFCWGFPGASLVKNPPANAGDSGSVPGSGKFPGEGNGNLLQCSCLGNPMDREAWRATVHGVAKQWGTTQQLKQQNDVYLVLWVWIRNLTCGPLISSGDSGLIIMNQGHRYFFFHVSINS